MIACQDKKEDQNSEIDIISEEEYTIEVNETERPVPQSYMLAKMREEVWVFQIIDNVLQPGSPKSE